MPISAIIEVTDEDIENGAPHDPQSCPVALAIKRVFPKDDVYVASTFVDVWDREANINWTTPTPNKVRVFIDSFDNDVAVEPFVFPIFLNRLSDL